MRPAVPPSKQGGTAMQDLLQWRLSGSLVWAQLLLLAVELAYALLLLLIGHASGALALLGWRVLLLHALQCGVLAAHRRVLATSEAAPVQVPLVSKLVSRVLVRDRKASDIAAVAYLYGATAACAAAYTYLSPSVNRHSAATLLWSVVFGCAAAAVYSTQHLARCRDVLSYPVLQRHRYFQIKARIPSIAIASAKVSALALLLALLSRQAPFPGPLQLLSSCLSIIVCVVGWLLGQAMLDIVFSERPKLLRQAEVPFDALVSSGLSSSEGLVQDLTLMELACVAEESSAAATAARQAVAFADESGRLAWTPLGGFLLGEVRDLTTQLAAVLPPTSGDAAASAGAGAAAGRPLSHAQWNALSLATSTRAPEVKRGQDLAAWAMRSRFYRAGWCMRTLAALTAASRAEDRFGVLLLCEPNLADVMTALLSAILVLQQYGRAMSSMTASLGPVARASHTAVEVLCLPAHPTVRQVETLAFALEDLARTCAYRVVLAFGPSLKAAMKEAKQKPAYGSASDVAALLDGMLNFVE